MTMSIGTGLLSEMTVSQCADRALHAVLTGDVSVYTDPSFFRPYFTRHFRTIVFLVCSGNVYQESSCR
jgi:hypothetical protein